MERQLKLTPELKRARRILKKYKWDATSFSRVLGLGNDGRTAVARFLRREPGNPRLTEVKRAVRQFDLKRNLADLDRAVCPECRRPYSWPYVRERAPRRDCSSRPSPQA